jgi:hypothetical protein
MQKEKKSGGLYSVEKTLQIDVNNQRVFFSEQM